MFKHNIYLSGGVTPWLGIKNTIKLAKECGFDGVELLPTRIVTKELSNDFNPYIKESINIKGLHQNWRLDIGQDKKYGISFTSSIFYLILRHIFFPKIESSQKILTQLSNTLSITTTVHEISEKWIRNSDKKEFTGGINFEIIGNQKITKSELKRWLIDEKHGIVVDTRDDQSICWAKKNGFKNFIDFWTWIGTEKIKCVQLTLIGGNGIKRILTHKETLAEKELLWLNKMAWKGSIVVEINPLMLFFINFGNVKNGLKEIILFIRTTLDAGKLWTKDTSY